MRTQTICVLLSVISLVSCHPKSPPPTLPTEYASAAPKPAPADLLQGCSPPEALQLRSFLGLLPPWDKERPSTMLALGFALEESKTPECLQAAKQMFFELSIAYPNQREARRATLEVGAISLFLQEPAVELEQILGQYANRSARLLEVSKSTSSEKAVAFLRTYGGEQAGELIAAYTAWRLRGGPLEQDKPQELQRPTIP
jgi:hypothetical protein